MNPNYIKEFIDEFRNQYNELKNKGKKEDGVLDEETISSCENLFENIDKIYQNIVNNGSHYEITTLNEGGEEGDKVVSFSALDFLDKDLNLRQNLETLNNGGEIQKGNRKIKKIRPQNNNKIFQEQYDLYVSALKNINTIQERYEANKKNAQKNPNAQINVISETINSYASFLKPFIQEDIMGFNVIKRKHCKSLDDMYTFVRGGIFDTNKITKKKYGANQSSRYKMSFNFVDGHESTGFFTKNVKFNPNEEIDKAKEKFDKIFANTPFYENFYAKVFKAAKERPTEMSQQALTKFAADRKLNIGEWPDFFDQHKYSFDNVRYLNCICKLSDHLSYGSGGYSFDFKNNNELDDALKAFNYNLAVKKELKDYILNINKAKNKEKQEFFGTLFAFAKTFRSPSTSCSINQSNLLMFKGADIGYRNCAMSAVDKLLGTDVLADSHKVTIYENNKKVDGIFMEEAQGTDFVGLKGNDPRYLVTSENANNPKLLKSISNLQIIDYLCGNVDRHGLNFFYKFDKNNENIIGLIGIDNDSSFTKRPIDVDESYNQLPALTDLKAIDKKTADRILLLGKDDLVVTLKPYGLDSDEIDAAYKRLRNLQIAIGENEKKQIFYKTTKRIENSDRNELHLTILDDDDWNKIKINELIVINKNDDEKEHKNIYNLVQERLKKIDKYSYIRKFDSDVAHQNLAIIRTTVSNTKVYFDDLKNQLSEYKDIPGLKRIYDSLIYAQNNTLKDFDVTKFNPINKPNEKFENDFLAALNNIKENGQNYLKGKNKIKADLVNQMVEKINNIEDYIKETTKNYKKDYSDYCNEKENQELCESFRRKNIKKNNKIKAQNKINESSEIDDKDYVAGKPNFLDENINEDIDVIEFRDKQRIKHEQEEAKKKENVIQFKDDKNNKIDDKENQYETFKKIIFVEPKDRDLYKFPFEKKNVIDPKSNNFAEEFDFQSYYDTKTTPEAIASRALEVFESHSSTDQLEIRQAAIDAINSIPFQDRSSAVDAVIDALNNNNLKSITPGDKETLIRHDHLKKIAKGFVNTENIKDELIFLHNCETNTSKSFLYVDKDEINLVNDAYQKLGDFFNYRSPDEMRRLAKLSNQSGFERYENELKAELMKNGSYGGQVFRNLVENEQFREERYLVKQKYSIKQIEQELRNVANSQEKVTSDNIPHILSCLSKYQEDYTKNTGLFAQFSNSVKQQSSLIESVYDKLYDDGFFYTNEKRDDIKKIINKNLSINPSEVHEFDVFVARLQYKDEKYHAKKLAKRKPLQNLDDNIIFPKQQIHKKNVIQIEKEEIVINPQRNKIKDDLKIDLSRNNSIENQSNLISNEIKISNKSSNPQEEIVLEQKIKKPIEKPKAKPNFNVDANNKENKKEAIKQPQKNDLVYRSLLQNNNFAANKIHYNEYEQLNEKLGYEYELPEGRMPLYIFKKGNTYFNSTGFLTKMQATAAFKENKTIGIIDENGEATLNVLEENNNVRTFKMDRKDRYQKMLNFLNENKINNKYSDEYSEMKKALEFLANGKDESKYLYLLKSNINLLKKDPLNKSFINKIDNEAIKAYKEKKICDKFLLGFEIADNVKAYKEDEEQYVRKNPYQEKVLNYELNDMNVDPDKKFDSKQYIKDGHISYHDVLDNICDFAEDNPDSQEDIIEYLDRAKHDFPDNQKTEITNKWDKAIRNGKANQLDDKDQKELQADKYANAMGNGMENTLKAYSGYIALILVLLVLTGATGGLALMASSLIEGKLVFELGKEALSASKKVFDEADENEGKTPSKEDYMAYLEQCEKEDRERIKEIRHKQLAKLYYQKGLHDAQKAMENEEKYRENLNISEKNENNNASKNKPNMALSENLKADSETGKNSSKKLVKENHKKEIDEANLHKDIA